MTPDFALVIPFVTSQVNNLSDVFAINWAGPVGFFDIDHRANHFSEVCPNEPEIQSQYTWIRRINVAWSVTKESHHLLLKSHINNLFCSNDDAHWDNTMEYLQRMGSLPTGLLTPLFSRIEHLGFKASAYIIHKYSSNSFDNELHF